jgi:hypothetical protein
MLLLMSPEMASDSSNQAPRIFDHLLSFRNIYTLEFFLHVVGPIAAENATELC